MKKEREEVLVCVCGGRERKDVQRMRLVFRD